MKVIVSLTHAQNRVFSFLHVNIIALTLLLHFSFQQYCAPPGTRFFVQIKQTNKPKMNNQALVIGLCPDGLGERAAASDPPTKPPFSIPEMHLVLSIKP